MSKLLKQDIDNRRIPPQRWSDYDLIITDNSLDMWFLNYLLKRENEKQEVPKFDEAFKTYFTELLTWSTGITIETYPRGPKINCLCYALNIGLEIDIVQFIHETFPDDINWRSRYRREADYDALWVAQNKDNLIAFKYLVEQGADVNRRYSVTMDGLVNDDNTILQDIVCCSYVDDNNRVAIFEYALGRVSTETIHSCNRRKENLLHTISEECKYTQNIPLCISFSEKLEEFHPDTTAKSLMYRPYKNLTKVINNRAQTLYHFITKEQLIKLLKLFISQKNITKTAEETARNLRPMKNRYDLFSVLFPRLNSNQNFITPDILLALIKHVISLMDFIMPLEIFSTVQCEDDEIFVIDKFLEYIEICSNGDSIIEGRTFRSYLVEILNLLVKYGAETGPDYKPPADNTLGKDIMDVHINIQRALTMASARAYPVYYPNSNLPLLGNDAIKCIFKKLLQEE